MKSSYLQSRHAESPAGFCGAQREIPDRPDTPYFVFREGAFAMIAPFLDLDYHATGVLTIQD